MRAAIKWVGGMSFVGESGSGHTVMLDGAPQFGGRNIAPRPMEMVLIGLGGCNGFDIVRLLKEAGQRIRGVELQLDAERSEDTPAVFTEIRGHYIVSGYELDERIVEEVIEASTKRYSSVSRMLEHSARITYDYEIINFRK